MITTNIPNSTSISVLNAKVDINTNSTLVSCTCGDYLQEFVLHREGDTSKFFGFGVSHKIDIVLIDLDRKLKTIQRGDTVNVALGSNGYFDYPYPTMYVTELGRNEKSNNISCTAYDSLYKANYYTVSELNINYPAKVSDLMTACSTLIGAAGVVTNGIENELLSIEFSEELNFNGDEQARILLDAIAEFTQSIYYINNQNKLVFKRLNKDAESVLTVTKEMYFELTTLTPRTLTGLCHATELGDNIATLDNSGTVQIMRDNPLYELNTNTATLLDEAAARISGFTIHQLDCEWDGNHLLEIGDKVAFVTEEDESVFTYIINDVIEYQGFINEITTWEYTQDDSETATNPTNIGEKINQTVAKVDKVNKEITLMAQEVTDTKSELAELKLTTDDIILRVEKVEKQEIEIDLDLTNDTNFIALTERVGQLEISDTNITASVTALETKTSTDLSTAVSGLEGEIGTLESNINTLDSTLRNEITAGDNALSGEITTVKQDVSALQIKANEIEASVSSLESSTSTNLSNAISGIEGNLEELEEALRAEYENADELLNESIDGEFTAVRQDISSLRVETNSITASVSSLQKVTENTTDALENEIASLAKEVNLKVDSEAVSISIAKALDAGVDKVKTSSKNYTFDDEGLNISSSDSDFNTTVNEDGMKIYKGSTEVLIANNEGVTATDLHARTFLIIGENSRLEDRGSRTACFWIGKAGG